MDNYTAVSCIMSSDKAKVNFEYMEIFSKRLKEQRKAAGFTQQQMAELLGIKQQSYTRYENNKGEPNLETVVCIAAILDVSSDFLLGITDF